MELAMNGRKLHCAVTGEGRPILLVHGLGGSVGTFSRMLPLFSKGYRILLPDLSGFGRSERGPEPLSVLGWAEEMHALLQSVSAVPAVVVGHSLGGMIAQVLAAEHPEAVSRLILANSYIETRDGYAARAETVRRQGMGPVLADTGNSVFSHKGGKVPPEIEGPRREALSGMDPENYAQACEALSGLSTRPYLDRIHCPVLIIAGAEDRSSTVAVNTEMKENIPGSELVVVENTGHLAPMEEPGRFVQEIERFAG